MPEVTEPAVGFPSWVELSSPDLEVSKRFYCDVFGWYAYTLTAGSVGEYEMFTLGDIQGPAIGGMYELADDSMQSSWTIYFRTADLDASLDLVRAAGGQVLVEPVDIADLGRMAQCSDSQGADFAFWYPYNLKGAEAIDEPSAMCWVELSTPDVREARRFYGQVFGWEPVDRHYETLSYTEWKIGDRSIAGMMRKPEGMPAEVPSHWAPNFAIIAFMVIMSAVIFAWMYSAYFAPPDNSAPTGQAAETPEADQEVAVIDEDDTEAEDVDDGLAAGGGESIVTASDDEESPENGEDEPAEHGEESESSLASEEGAADPTPEPEPVPEDGIHTFVISTTQPVWVHATVDGEIVLDDVVQPGAAVTFEGESMSLRSGNAPHVNVIVDGEDRGPVGEVWDAPNSYP
jgi:uncharacterized protein